MKRWLMLCLCVALLMTLIACGGKQPDIYPGDTYRADMGADGYLELSFAEETVSLCRIGPEGEQLQKTEYTWVFDSETQRGSLYSGNSAQEFWMEKKGLVSFMGYAFQKQ